MTIVYKNVDVKSGALQNIAFLEFEKVKNQKL
jgi:hypothetical protein